MITRRQTLLLAAAGAAPVLRNAHAQDAYPSKPIRLVVPVNAGTATDQIARYMATRLGQVWKAPTMVENKIGASGMIATDFVAKSPADGYTLLATYAVHYSNPWLMDKMPYDAQKDFEPLVKLANSKLVFIVPTDSPYRTLGDLVEAARKNPGQITYGTAGVGTMGHVCALRLASMAKIDLKHVPYKSSTQPITDAVSGQVNLTITGIAGAIGLIKAGRLRPLATTGIKRSGTLPDVPTVDEAGYKGYDVTSPVWIMAPAGTPRVVVQKLSSTMLQMAQLPEFKDLCAAQGMDAELEDVSGPRNPATAELRRWKELIALTGAKSGS
ncbi:Bug family tripartite tricarboxylate transporter substrate binding protein [Ramlibacter sp.]|uniref:Bug family tripartite tricarboxylate transporter substrate binding protein n=1 Tax=Ramlibacter sp. TaxID=1917967 RepID=UPI003D0AAEDF